MDRLFVASLLGLLGLFISPCCAQSDEVEPHRQVLALQAVFQKVIRDVEPSVACILVSRSDLYRRFAPGPGTEPGRLGAFDSAVLDFHPNYSKEERDRLRRQLDLGDPGHVPESFGSGVVLDEAGLVLTNYHVVREATKVYVRLSGGKGSYADIHAADPRSDLAVLRLLHPPGRLQPARLGDGGKIERGQFILTLAHPFAAGFRDGQASASWGIVSNLRRRAPGSPREEERLKTLHHYGTLVQTDARLQLGCSGGALVNLDGELIGLTTALAALQGSETPGGFAVPLDAGLRRILDVLCRGEEVEYGFLGVGLEDNRPRGEGVVLSYITPGSPADWEGRLRPQDTILRVNGVAVRDADELFLTLGTLLAGSRVRLEIRRAAGAVVQPVEVTLARFYVPGKTIASSHGSRPFFRGLRVDHTSLLVQQPPRQLRIPTGVLVTEVQPDSAAATVQLKPGEIITHVNGRPVTNPPAFYRAIAGARGPVELTLPASSPVEPAPKVVLQ